MREANKLKVEVEDEATTEINLDMATMDEVQISSKTVMRKDKL